MRKLIADREALLAEGKALGMPERAIRAFMEQRGGAGRRGSEFLFPLSEWWAWWQTDGRWERRGIGKHSLCMARVGDVGPYHPNNVYCATHSENVTHGQRGRPKKRNAIPPNSEADARFGLHFRTARKQAGLSQRQLATEAGIMACTLSEFENGIGNPTIVTLGRIARALNMSLDFVFTRPTN